MTIEELLDCSADQLERMTDAELLNHFAPYLNVTRPELCTKPSGQSVSKPLVNPALTKAIALLKEKGIDLPTFSDKLTTRKR